MGKHGGGGHGGGGKALGEGEPRAGGGERFKSQRLQIARRTHVPGIGDDETSFGMELAERCAFFGRGGHGEASGRWLGDCLWTSAMCRMDRQPQNPAFSATIKSPMK